MSELAKPKSGLPLEVEFCRLLQRCQEITQGDDKGRQDLQDWATSPTFHSLIDMLQEQVTDLVGLNSSRLDTSVLDGYQAKVKALVRRLQPVSIPNFIKAERRVETSDSAEALPQSYTEPTSQSVPSNESRFSLERAKPVFPAATQDSLRSRAGARSQGAGLVGGPLQQDTKERLERQSHLQDDLTEEMVALAAGLKRNALAMQAAVARREGLLSEAEDAVDSSLVYAKKHSKEASKLKVRGSWSFCTILLLMAVTCMVLVGTYMFIKSTSFLGYKRTMTVRTKS